MQPQGCGTSREGSSAGRRARVCVGSLAARCREDRATSRNEGYRAEQRWIRRVARAASGAVHPEPTGPSGGLAPSSVLLSLSLSFQAVGACWNSGASRQHRLWRRNERRCAANGDSLRCAPCGPLRRARGSTDGHRRRHRERGGSAPAVRVRAPADGRALWPVPLTVDRLALAHRSGTHRSRRVPAGERVWPVRRASASPTRPRLPAHRRSATRSSARVVDSAAARGMPQRPGPRHPRHRRSDG